MGKLFAAIVPLLMPLIAFAQDANAPEPEPASMAVVWVFVVLFVVACVGVPWYMWAAQKKEQKKTQLAEKA